MYEKLSATGKTSERCIGIDETVWLSSSVLILDLRAQVPIDYALFYFMEVIHQIINEETRSELELTRR